MEANRIAPVEEMTIEEHWQTCAARIAVAHDPNTAPAVLAALADDTDYWVREVVASNPNTPYEALESLAADKLLGVRRKALLNHAVPFHAVIDDMCGADPQKRLWWAWYTKSPSVLAFLAEDPSVLVRRKVAWSKYTASDVLSKLAKSADPNTAFGAKTQLERRAEEESAIVAEAVAA